MNSAKSSVHTLNHEPKTLKPPVVLSSPFANLYVTNISIGSKHFSSLLVGGTGGDDIWLQCEGCTSCFPVKGGSFPVKESKTYHSLACKHQFCVPKSCNEAGECSYNWKYREGSVTMGVLSSDSLTFPENNSTSITFPSIIFGCGYDNQNISFGRYMGGDNVIAGVFGLGAGQRSILRQLEPQTNIRFSYCLRSYFTNVGSDTTFLRFGPDAQIKGDDKRKVQTVRLNPSTPRYYVNVTGISLEGKRLNIDPALFELKKGGSGGFAIDSGVGPTLLVPEAYKVLKSEVLVYLSIHGIFPVKVLHVPYDLCFLNPPAAADDDYRILPSLVIHLEGAFSG